jgi:hypothetical protein
MAKRQRTGRVNVDFAVIEKFAATEIGEHPLAAAGRNWKLSRKSSLHRRKDGSYTLCLIWRSEEGMQLTSTMRGLQLERAR